MDNLLLVLAGLIALVGLLSFPPGDLVWCLCLAAFAYALFTLVPRIGDYAHGKINGE